MCTFIQNIIKTYTISYMFTNRNMANFIRHAGQLFGDFMDPPHTETFYPTSAPASAASAPASASASASAPNKTHTFTECVLFNVDIDRQCECTICCEDFLEGSHAIILPCGHNFHKRCAEKWVNYKKTCPNCRNKVSIKSSLKKFSDRTFVNIGLLDSLPVKSLKIMMSNYNIDSKECIEKVDMTDMIRNKVFYNNKSLREIKEYLRKNRINPDVYMEKINLLNAVAFIRLSDRY